MASTLYIGLISGTSMDAIDCALVDFSRDRPNQLDFITTEIPEDLRQKLLRLCENHQAQIPLLGEADVEFARQLALAVNRILERNELKPSQVAAIGSHGQTIRHHPRRRDSSIPFTLQIGDPNTIVELTGITTVADFRRRDMAAGGQGAPIVPAFHRRVFSSAERDRVIVNIGGMSNITVLDKIGGIIGFDTGPGNVLMDYWIQQHKGHPYDRNGEWAKTGEVDDGLLQSMIKDPYFDLPAPKSTGRELFNSHWLREQLGKLEHKPKPQDVQATLLALTVFTISSAIRDYLSAGEIVLCGGGAYNKYLVNALGESLQGFKVVGSSKLGVMEDSMEAVAFAWLAHQTMHQTPIDFTTITGSSHPVIAGGIYYAGKRKQS